MRLHGGTHLQFSGVQAGCLEDESGELEGEGQPRSSPEEVMATMGTIISMFLRMQDIRQQQIVAEEILTQAIEDGQLPTIRRFSWAGQMKSCRPTCAMGSMKTSGTICSGSLSQIPWRT